jgi:hypothetical protein
MPITSFGSYRATTEEFVVNWGLADGELGANPLFLAGNYGREEFLSDRASLLEAMDSVSDLAAAARTAMANRESAKNALLTRARQFRGEVQGQIVDKDYLRELPSAPPISGDFDKFSQPLRAIVRLWTRINANTASLQLAGPLTLAGGYTLAQFETALGALPLLYSAMEEAEGNLGEARGKRNNRAKAIYERMLQYRKLAPARLPANSPALAQLPRLSPPPGTTPPPLVVTGAWDQQLVKARLTWTASGAENLQKLQVRGCTGGSYKSENEELIGDLPADATHWEGDWGLTVPGSIASFKVYVMTTTGNENGGKAVKVVRPVT